MKKVYVKPEIIFESFSLSEHIAAGCDVIVGNPSKGSCAILGTGGIDTYSTGITGCTYEYSKEDPLCYHIPTEDSNLFNS